MSAFDATESPDISAIITCFREERSIREFHRRLSSALDGLQRPYEIVFVNDGSEDGTLRELRAIFEADRHVTAVLDLFRNSGQGAAMAAGIREARGRSLLFMDSDLQLSPEDLPRLVVARDAGADVVSGWRVDRKDSWLRIVPSKLANVVMRRASRSGFRDFGCTFKIIDAELVRAFDFGPHRAFSPVDVIAAAGRCQEVPVSHRPRPYGRSGWTFRKLFRYNMDNLVILSDRPFQLVGVVCLALALAFALRTALAFLVPFSILGTVTTGLLLNAIAVSTLVVVALLGLVGEFTIRSFIAARRVPCYVVRERLRRGTPGGARSS